jgi:hypothetical protein
MAWNREAVQARKRGNIHIRRASCFLTPLLVPCYYFSRFDANPLPVVQDVEHHTSGPYSMGLGYHTSGPERPQLSTTIAYPRSLRRS